MKKFRVNFRKQREFWPKMTNFEFSTKSETAIFRMMRRFLRKSIRTYVRTSEIPRDQKVAHENLQATTQMYKIITQIII